MIQCLRNKGGKLGAIAGGLALATAFIGGWEGLRLVAYPDRLAGNIPTVCYGETRGVSLGDTYTREQCDAMLSEAIVEFDVGLDRCMKPPAELPLETRVAFVSWSYNVGINAACGSTLVRLVNSGNYIAACNQLPRWNRAGGQVVRGLVNRRAAERELCLSGLAGKTATAVVPVDPVNHQNPQLAIPRKNRDC